MADAPFIPACPLGCATTLQPTEVVLPEGPLRRCPECGQQVSSATEARYLSSMQEFDAPEGTDAGFSNRKRVLRAVEKRIRRHEALSGQPRSAQRWLDVGCSSGGFIKAAKTQGCNIEGVEPAPRAAAAAREAGLTVFTGTLQEAHFPDASFDAVSLSEVIEHLRDPASLLQEIRRLLKPNGVFSLTTGNAESWTMRWIGPRWEYLDLNRHGGHVSFFTPSSLDLLAKRCGLKLVRLETRAVTFSEKGEHGPIKHRVLKAASELLNLPAAMTGNGHKMLAFFQAV
jgi:SAM-dependent methyltransferase